MTLDEVKTRFEAMRHMLVQAEQNNDELCDLTSRDSILLKNGLKISVTLVTQHMWLKKLEAHVDDWLKNCKVMEDHFARLDAVIDAALETCLDDEMES